MSEPKGVDHDIGIELGMQKANEEKPIQFIPDSDPTDKIVALVSPEGDCNICNANSSNI